MKTKTGHWSSKAAFATTAGAAAVLFAWAEAWAPEPELTVCQWADENVVLSSKASAEPGQFRSDRTPYVKEILESLSPTSPCQRVVWMAGAQLGKSQSGFNWIGAVADMWPGPMLMVQPTVDMAKKVSKQRIAPMIESTAALRKKFGTARSKDASNTMLEKEYPGGMLMLTGANSASGLRSMPIRYLYLDEVDAYPYDVDGEGSPMDLAERRTTTFARRKVFITSTPTVKGFSAVEREFDKTDKRYYYVPCPHCGEHDIIKWKNIKYDPADPKNTAKLLCEHCGCLIDEHHKTDMLARGEWRATAVSQNGTRGYHLSGLYSPLGWKSWGDCAQEWVDAQENVEKLQVFWNTVLGETWEDRGDSLDPSLLGSRTEEYKAEVPAGVRILTAAIDVQDDRLELKVKGYGEREESWLIAYSQHYGDPSQDDVWHEVDEVLQHRFKVEGGGTMGIDTTFVDSGGHHSDSVYKFCKARTTRRVFPLRGVQQVGRPIISNPSRNNKYRVPLYNIGVDAAKDTVFARLKIEKNGPGRMHYPKADWCDEEYFAMLTAERPVRKWVKRRGVVKEWVQMRPRNEAFDLEVYCLAALYTRGFAHLQKLLGVRNVDKAGLSQEEAAAENNKKTASSASAGATPAEAAQRPKWGSNRPTAARPKWGTAVS